MFLHNDKELFRDVIEAASADQNRPVAIIEKDYYGKIELIICKVFNTKSTQL